MARYETAGRRPVIRTILHVDMDAFYAAVEQRDHPEYRGRPVIVGSDPKGGLGRGIVATCSYEARAFGVHSAQPISRAWRCCPHGIYVRPDMQKYARVSACVMDILGDYTDLVEQVSIDEAFLDVTGSRQLFGTGVEIAEKIKRRIRTELQLTASVGVAGNKFVAKIASDLKKPDGLVAVEFGREREFLAPLPVGRLWGVGPKTEANLKSMGIKTIGQLLEPMFTNRISRMGKTGGHLLGLARGEDDRPVDSGDGFKSIGHETTFEKDTTDFRLLEKTLLDLVERVAHRLREQKARTRTIAVKFREADFSTYSRRTSLGRPADTTERIFPAALALMKSLMREGVPVRLIGVQAGSLEVGEGGMQMSLYDRMPQRDRDLAAAMDDIVLRFGKKSLTRAALVPAKKSPTSD
jgi:DNA polymerase-4